MRSTLIVRKVMRQFNKRQVFTNLYDTCRTVKCYAGKNDSELIASIEKSLTDQNIAFTIKRVTYSSSRPLRGWGPANSIIVRLPL